MGPASWSCPLSDWTRVWRPPVTMVIGPDKVLLPAMFWMETALLLRGAKVMGLGRVIPPVSSSRVDGPTDAPLLAMWMTPAPRPFVELTRRTPLPPLLKVAPEVAERAPVTWRVPALTVVSPVKVLLPERTREPNPDLTSAPEPALWPLRVRTLALSVVTLTPALLRASGT